MRVLLVANRAWNFRNFRWGLIKNFKMNGDQVLAVAAADGVEGELLENDVQFIPIAMDSKTKNPFKDLLLILRLVKLYKKVKPDIILHFTIKPNIYGSLAAGFLKIPCIDNITGLGNVFLNDGLVNNIVVLLYKIAVARAAKVFFQNSEDMRLFLKQGIAIKEKSDLLPGSGIDIEKFSPREEPAERSHTTFLLAARMIWEKGIKEYVEAAELIKKDYPDVVFQIAGELGVHNPSAIPESEVLNWEENGIINYMGYQRDIRELLCGADCIVLPSYYREGVPRTLLEAASMGKPIVTTDNIGCREVVRDGENGYLCAIRNSTDLADKITQFIKLSENDRIAMGKKSREVAVRFFDEKIVIKKYVDAINEIKTGYPGNMKDKCGGENHG